MYSTWVLVAAFLYKDIDVVLLDVITCQDSFWMGASGAGNCMTRFTGRSPQKMGLSGRYRTTNILNSRLASTLCLTFTYLYLCSLLLTVLSEP